MGGSSGLPVNFPPVPLELADGSPNLRMVVTRSVLEDRIINIPAAYADQEFDFSGTRAFDTRTGYHSRSLLAVPPPRSSMRTKSATWRCHGGP